MGYYVMLENSDFTIPKGRLDEALQALKDLNKRDDLKTGGSWQGGKQTGRWFAWMPEDYDQTVTSVREVLELLGFECDEDDEGRLEVWGYDSKTGAEEHFIEALAPFAHEGSWMEWRGEEGEQYRWVVESGQLRRQHAQVTWS